ncbi:XPG protein [Ancylostoma caninum]|uniref:Exonuclease 1 n=1 Tax=Ancylostoma caninum TaxID=29170 RepID=A0A368FMU2_ANCCA|nr:XPG protein [Ancylostoma caninum]
MKASFSAVYVETLHGLHCFGHQMGIQNLLPFVKKACRQGNISEFAGCSVAVDVSCLLHRGLFGCMESVAQGKKTTFYIHYVSKHIKALLDLGCHVIMVFDGRPLPAKKNTNDERRQRRAENVKAAELLLSEGKINEAVDKFKRATSITPEVVESTIEHFRSYKNVDVIVSPYESDAQLAFLVNEGLADVVVTEDSDLIAFGCEKASVAKRECTIYEKKELPRCFSGVMSSQFDFTKFRRICILSGCDYLQAGLPGIGLNKALSFFSKTSRTDLKTLLPRIPNYLNMSKLTVSKEFIEEFIRAENTFIHQVIFDPRQRCQRPLTPYPCARKEDHKGSDENDDDFVMPDGRKETSEFSYAGEVLSSNLAVRLALGNQIEKSVITDKFFLPSPVPEWSVWSDRFESCGKRKRRLEEERKREEKKCGSAFRFDSPSRKRVKLDTSATIDFIDLEPEIGLEEASKPNKEEQKQSDEKAYSQSESVPNKPALENGTNPQTTRPKSLKNQANCSWTVDEVMKMYGSQGATSTPSTSTTAAAAATKSQPTVASAATITTVTASTGLGRSAYFVRRSASCANPFRKPVLKPISTTPKADAKGENSQKAETALEKEEADTNPVGVTMIKAIGCRPPGLRASFSS